MKFFYLKLCLIACIFFNCSSIKETSQHQMESGIYKVKNQAKKNFYVEVAEDTISLHPLTKIKKGWLADTNTTSVIFMSATNPVNKQPVTFVTRSFDLDVLTILFKYRPYISGFPNQLNTNFNAAGYIGHRSDLYILSFDKNPLNIYRRRMSHFGYSFGFFGGLGSTSMNPFVTNNQVTTEYDGVVITKGLSGMIGIGNLTFGLAIGLDHLMDNNSKVWIYQAKPWTGFTVGLNLN